MSEATTTKKRRVSYGQEPLEYLDKNKATLFFDIHNFADLSHKPSVYIRTKTIEAFGHVWSLKLYPRGYLVLNIDAGSEHVSIYLQYEGENTKTNPVIAACRIGTKTKESSFTKCNFSMSSKYMGDNYKKREDMIREDLDKDGTLTIKVDIIIGTKQCDVWFPKINPFPKDDIGPHLYSSLEKDDTTDVTFRVGPLMVERKAHRNVLSVRAPALYEMIISTTTTMDEEGIVLRDIDPHTFGTILEYIYTNKVPKVHNDHNHATVEGEEFFAKSILIVANQFGCTGLKLYMESFIVGSFLNSSNAARLLLFADSHACALLKEACMTTYITDPMLVKRSEDDWNQLKESSDLLVELLEYSTSSVGDARGSRKHFSSVVTNGDGTIHDADTFDVTSIRERLEKYHLDTDGSAEMLLQRWKEHLLAL